MVFAMALLAGACSNQPHSLDHSFPEAASAAPRSGGAPLTFEPTLGLSQPTEKRLVEASYLYFNEAGEIEVGIPYYPENHSESEASLIRGDDAVRFKGGSLGLTRGVIANGVPIQTQDLVYYSTFDSDGRVWVAVHAKSVADADRRRHGFEVYDRQGALLFKVQVPPEGGRFIDAHGDQTIWARNSGQRNFNELEVRLLTTERNGRTVW